MNNLYSIKKLDHQIDLSFCVPGSKSITNRVFLIAMLANGISQIRGALESDDTKHMQNALIGLGINVKKIENNFTIKGNNGVFSTNEEIELFLGNAGTAVRFLTAVLSLRDGRTIVTGNTRMQERPIKDLIDGLVQLGVNIYSLNSNGCPPIEITGNTLEGGICKIPGNISSQFFSAILLTAPYAKNLVTLEVQGKLCSKPYIDITINEMKKF